MKAAPVRSVPTPIGYADEDLQYLRTGMRDLTPFRDAFAGAAVRGIGATELASSGRGHPGANVEPIRIEHHADGSMVLTEGRLRLASAREAGASKILATVVDVGPRGGVRSEETRVVKLLPSRVHLPTTVEVRPPPEISKRPGPFTYWVKDIGGGRVMLTRAHGENFGIKMPADSLKHFVNDLSGKVELPPSGRPEIDAVLQGKATLLGKGDDGIAFRVGDQVVKVSTTVPSVPENDYHRSPEEAVQQLREQTATHNKLAAVTGNTCLQRAEFIQHRDKGFQIKPFVEGVGQFTRAELDRLQDCIIAIHGAGYAIKDLIQAGLDSHGQPVMFDVGKAAPIPPEDDFARARRLAGVGDPGRGPVVNDMDRLAELYRTSGHVFIRRDIDEGQQKWKGAVAGAHRAAEARKGIPWAWHMLSTAAEFRRGQAPALLEGGALMEKLQGIDEDLRRERDRLSLEDVLAVRAAFDDRYGHGRSWSPEERALARSQAEAAVGRALTAGARPPLLFQGMGSEGIVLCDARGHAFKMGRFHEISDEAEWLETAAKVPEVAKHVATFIKYHPEADAIERACIAQVEEPVPRWKVDLYGTHTKIAKEMRKHGWNMPEFAEDAYVETADRGPILVDAGFVLRLGDRMAAYVEDVLAGKRPWRTDKPKDLAWALRMDFDEPRPPRVQALLEELQRRQDAEGGEG